MLGQRREDGRTAARVGRRGDQPAWLVIEEEPRAFAPRQRRAVDQDEIARRDVDGRRGDHAAVERDAPGHDPLLGLAARSEPRAGDHLGDPLGIFRGRWVGTAFVDHGVAV